jgi:PAT family beta-lactamase induction signal transducer AmpG
MSESSKRWLFYVFLGVLSGVPLPFITSTLQLWLAQSHASLSLIGQLSLITLPYTFRFLWVPLLEVYFIGHCCYHSWIAIFGFFIGLTLIAMSMLSPEVQQIAICGCALLLCFFSASFDAMLDGYRLKYVSSHDLGKNASAVGSGYRFGLLLTAGGGVIAADFIGFPRVYVITGLLMTCASLCMLISFKNATHSYPDRTRVQHKNLLKIFLTLFKVDFIGLIVIILGTYRLCDTLLGSLTNYFLYDVLGYSLKTIGASAKIVGPLTTLIGGFVGAVWIEKAGLYRSMWFIGLIQALANLSFLYLYYSNRTTFDLLLVMSLENFCGGLAHAALVVFLSTIAMTCEHKATSYALLAATFSLTRALSGVLASALVEYFGWVWFIQLTACVVVIPLIALMRYHKKCFKRDLFFKDTAVLTH